MKDVIELPSIEDYPVQTITQEDINGVFHRAVTNDEKVRLSLIYRAYQDAGRLQGNFTVPVYE